MKLIIPKNCLFIFEIVIILFYFVALKFSYCTKVSDAFFHLNVNYTMYIQTHYTNCCVKKNIKCNWRTEQERDDGRQGFPSPSNLITLAFTGLISALKLLTKLPLIPEWESECLGFHCSGWSGCNGLPLIRRNQISLFLMHGPFRKAPIELILIMTRAQPLPSSDEVMCRHGVL